MTMRIVPDTMVLISGGTVSSSYTGQIMRAWKAGTIEVASSDPILAEVRRVLDYPNVEKIHSWTTEERDGFIADVRGSAIMVAGTTPIQTGRDRDDDKFIACAVEAGAAYIVSKDADLLDIGSTQGIEIVKPGYFVEQVLKQKAA